MLGHSLEALAITVHMIRMETYISGMTWMELPRHIEEQEEACGLQELKLPNPFFMRVIPQATLGWMLDFV